MRRTSVVISALEQLQYVRRRQLQVREAFSRGLAGPACEHPSIADFCLACADYLVVAQRRLIDQDLRLANLLTERVPGSQTADHEAIAALVGRLDQANTALGLFSESVQRYRSRYPEGPDVLVAAARQFLDFLVRVLGAKSHSLRHLTSTLLDERDWTAIAALDSTDLAAEREHFDQVRRCAPPNCDPAEISAQRPAASGGT